MSELKLSYRVASKMMENTKFEHELGIELIEVDDGFAKMKMEVKESLLNDLLQLRNGLKGQLTT